MNLVSNAIEHSNGEKIEISAQNMGQTSKIAVKNSGHGIVKEELEKIFEKYASSGGKTVSGLGLGIVKSLVEKHGGKISVESEVNYYTKFEIELPNKEG